MKFSILLLFIVDCAATHAQDSVLSWYPLEVGNSWIWQNESLDGDWVHPTFERWTMEQTIISIAPDAELVELCDEPQSRAQRRRFTRFHRGEQCSTSCCARIASADVPPMRLHFGWPRGRVGKDRARLWPPRAAYQRNCCAARCSPDFCLPLTVGMTWGRIPSRGLDPDFIWNVVSLNADPYGPPTGRDLSPDHARRLRNVD